MSDSEVEIDDFAKDILERAQVRTRMIKSNFQPTVSEKQKDMENIPAHHQEQREPRVRFAPIVTSEELSGSGEEEGSCDEDVTSVEPSSEEENKLPSCPPAELANMTKLEVDTESEVVPVGQRKPLKRLGELYGGAMIWSPAHAHTEGERAPDATPSMNDDKTIGRRNRLNALAKKINDWEDDLTRYIPPASRFNLSPPKQARKSTFSSPVTNLVRNSNCLSNKNAPLTTAVSNLISFSSAETTQSKAPRGAPSNSWDESVLNALEAQGFVVSENKTKLTYAYKCVLQAEDNPSASEEQSRNTAPSKRSKPVSPPRKSKDSPVRNVVVTLTSPERGFCQPIIDATPRGKLTVAEKAALFESKSTPSVALLDERDPTELTVAQRAKFFEQQSSGIVPKPLKPIFSQPRPVCQANNETPVRGAVPTKKHEISFAINSGKVESQRRMFERGERVVDLDEEEQPKSTGRGKVDIVPIPPPVFTRTSPAKPIEEDFSVTFSALGDTSPINRDRKSRSRSQTPMKESVTPGQSTTPKRSASQSPSRTRRSSTSPNKKNYPGARDVKRIRVNDPKAGRIYPSLTDIESTETETEAEPEIEEEEETLCAAVSQTSSLGTQIERMAKQNVVEKAPVSVPTYTATPKRNRNYRPTEDFSTSLACREIDAMIDDALEGQDLSIDTINEEGLCDAEASSTPIASTSVERESLPHRTAAGTNDQDESTLEDNRFGKTEYPNNPLHIGRDDDGPESSIDDILEEEGVEKTTSFVFCNTRFDLDNGTSNKKKSKPPFHIQWTRVPALGTLFLKLGLNSRPLDMKRRNGSPLESSSPVYGNRQESSPGSSLFHTVSFFRMQQQQMQVTPRRMCEQRDEPQVSSPDRRTARVEAVNDIIKKLEEELTSQHRSISQVSKALNLCKSTVEFSESTENIECERILLIASQKRTGILNEIHRLKTEGVLTNMAFISPSKHELGPSCRGKLNISEIAVQLKRDFITGAINGDILYHFIALLKQRNCVEASSLISIGHGVSSSHIQSGILHFPNSFTLEDLEPDFETKLDVYVLETQKEFLPHEAKYHIKKQTKESKGHTPKKLKTESKFSRAFQHSPAGPDAVRTTNFAICGSLTIDISRLARRFWNRKLDGVRLLSPVEGSVSLKIQCSAESGDEKIGFLTFFDDVSGYGAWHRRWCQLTAVHLSLWMYPEDEQDEKPPIDQIALRHCVTTRVCPVQRDVCARPNTFLLVTTRDPLPTDKESLVTSCHNGYTAIRHLISADCREERDSWCVQMNRTLANLRAWDPQAHSPDDTLF